MTFYRALFFCWFLLGLYAVSGGQTQESKEVSPSPSGFVQEFYGWYVPRARAEKTGPAWGLALKGKGFVFAPELARALKDDTEAQAKAEGEIVGIDFDPFLFSQDLCERYEAGPAIPQGRTYRVPVYGVCSGKKRAKPAVIAELIQQDNRWVFANFYYGKDGDLLAILKSLKADRVSPAK